MLRKHNNKTGRGHAKIYRTLSILLPAHRTLTGSAHTGLTIQMIMTATTSFLVLLVSTSTLVATGALLEKTCDSGSNACPPNSACKIFDKKQECLCDPKFQPSPTGSQCLKIVELGGNCAAAAGTTCRRGPWGKAECIDGICQCSVALGYERASDNRCKNAPITVGFSLLGEECSTTRVCQFALTQYCLDGRCTCKPGLKRAGEDMQSAKPFVDECVESRIVIETP